MGFNLAQICCNPPSSSSSTTQIFCNDNFNKCSPCRVPCCCRNSILTDHTYSILKRICHKIIKNYNRQLCREKYTVFDGGNSISPRWSDRQYREEGSEFSNSFRQRGWDKDFVRRDEFTNRNKSNKGYTDGAGDVYGNRGKISGKLQKDQDNGYEVKAGSRKSRKGKITTEDGRDDGPGYARSRNKKGANIGADVEQLPNKSKKKGEGKDDIITDSAAKADKGKPRKSKNRNGRDSGEADEKEGKLKGRKDKKAAKERDSDDTAEKEGRSKGRKPNKGAVEKEEKGRISKNRKDAKASDAAVKNLKENGEKDGKSKKGKARDSGDTTEKDGKSKGRKDRKSTGALGETGVEDGKSKKGVEKKAKKNSASDDINTSKKVVGQVVTAGEKSAAEASKSKKGVAPDASLDKDKKGARGTEASTSKKGAGQVATGGEKSAAEASKSKKGVAPDASLDKDKKGARGTEEVSTSKKGAGQVATGGEKSALETSKSKKGAAPYSVMDNDKKSARGTDEASSGEKGKHGKSAGGTDKKGANNSGMKDTTEDKGSKKTAQIDGKDSKKASKGDEKDDSSNANKKYGKQQKHSKGDIIKDEDIDQETVKKSTKFGKNKIGDKGFSRYSDSGTRHASQFRDNWSRTRKDIKDSKFIQNERPSGRAFRPTRSDEVRTCDILRVYMEQRDLSRCYPCRQNPCNVCRICPPCPTICC
ncbi:protein PIF [Drosophila sulfurigaster albostrigata]|uniref:protein PIF n=1 Tax=Drosophila sulfurigaster albostrigata TaxID=89887 RepID=UPI002D21C6DC|nr:protein PIF [Drosophila sulfurigaster albostrigata]